MRPHLAPAGAAAEDPLFGLLRARAAAHSGPRRRTDPHIVALVVEGGGMRGAVTAGMCLVLEAGRPHGLGRPCLRLLVGRVVGLLRGRRSGGAVGHVSFEDAACRAFIDPSRALRGRPVIDLGFLFDEVIARRRPLSEPGLASGPEFRAVAVSATRAEHRVLRDFESAADLLAAARASCSIPVLTGPPPTYRGEPTVDGGLLEPIPYRTALREGATHVLVLRSRDAAYRAPRQGRLAERTLARVPSRARAAARAAAATSTTVTRPSSSVEQRAPPLSRFCDRSRSRRAAASFPGSASIAAASSTASGWARTRWRPRSTARASRARLPSRGSHPPGGLKLSRAATRG